MNFGGFLGFISGAVVTNLRFDWSMLPRGRFQTDTAKLRERLKLSYDLSCQIPAVNIGYSRSMRQFSDLLTKGTARG